MALTRDKNQFLIVDQSKNQLFTKYRFCFVSYSVLDPWVEKAGYAATKRKAIMVFKALNGFTPEYLSDQTLSIDLTLLIIHWGNSWTNLLFQCNAQSLQGISSLLTKNRFSRFLHRVLCELAVLQGIILESPSKKRLTLWRRNFLIITVAFRMDFN